MKGILYNNFKDSVNKECVVFYYHQGDLVLE